MQVGEVIGSCLVTRHEVGRGSVFEVADIVDRQAISVAGGVGKHRDFWLPIAVQSRTQGRPPPGDESKSDGQDQSSTPPGEKSKRRSRQQPTYGGRCSKRRCRQVIVKGACRPRDGKASDQPGGSKEQKPEN